ncbi:hypothetical protein Moror_16744 [Moniliophthora roreri MCA 2997]|uniref:BTB domain-containing protein n=1 Tax=Moniliophthora roreri (strain MCA 2997) TaxID=1381753 RepID=V2WNH3_MONRO|nr:hypothetical protein Moror_16744 [Moniliophthora roreri MCA 2997]
MPSSKSPRFWLDDADAIVQVQAADSEAGDTLYKVHISKLSDQSPYFHSAFTNAQHKGPVVLDEIESGISNLHYANINRDRGVSPGDLDVLLDHLYRQNTLSAESEYQRIVSVLRISRPDQLDFPQIREQAVECFTSLFPTEPDVLATFRFDCAEDAMAVAMQNNIQKAQKPLLYYLVTQSHLDAFPSWIKPAEIDRITEQVMALMQRLIDQFTPILFTPPATSHMECTDIVADRWMGLVITPALNEGGTGKPLEELERMKRLDWEKEGVCASCAKDKRDEWTEEQQTIWKLLDGWIEEVQR